MKGACYRAAATALLAVLPIVMIALIVGLAFVIVEALAALYVYLEGQGVALWLRSLLAGLATIAIVCLIGFLAALVFED